MTARMWELAIRANVSLDTVMRRLLWTAVQNLRAISRVVRDSFTRWRGDQDPTRRLDFNGFPGIFSRQRFRYSAAKGPGNPSIWGAAGTG
jgi:hypothetical protein